jgi:RNA polymerase sigma factor (sigma-70 family)
MTDPGETARLLALIRLGDERARNDLFAHVSERLRLLTRHMLQTFPGVGRWEQTDDGLQNALTQLCQSLAGAQPESVLHFYNLAALEIRRELIDLARHYMGPHGQGGKHLSDEIDRTTDHRGRLHHVPTGEPTCMDAWATFHEKVALLPNDERELFGLLWYDGLTHDQAAHVLGVSLRTAKRRWQSARLKLIDALEGEQPR